MYDQCRDDYVLSTLFSGSNGGTSFAELNNSRSFTQTFTGGAALTSDNANFGSQTSLAVNLSTPTNGDGVSLLTTVPIAFDVYNFFIELVVRRNSTQASNATILQLLKDSSGMSGPGIRTNSSGDFMLDDGWTTYTTANAIPANTNTHLYLFKVGTTAYLYINGSLTSTYTGVAASATVPGNMNNTSGQQTVTKIGIGNTYTAASANGFSGYIQALSIGQFNLKWTANFTVPTSGSQFFHSTVPDVTAAPTTTIGPNSAYITINGAYNYQGLVQAFNNFVTTHGWTLHDMYGSTKITCVYRALNKNGTTYKYVIIGFDLLKHRMYLSSCESWNATTHIATNRTSTINSVSLGIGYNLTDVVVFAHARYLMIQTFQQNSQSAWIGCFETVQESVGDTAAAGYPNWVVVDSITSSFSGDYCNVRFCRTVSGATGDAAYNQTGFHTAFRRFGYCATDNLKIGNYLASDGTYGSVVYPWVANKKIAFVLQPVTGLIETHGAIFGLKASPYIGGPMSYSSMTCDSDFFPSQSGTATDHLITSFNKHTLAAGFGSTGTYVPPTTALSAPSANLVGGMAFDGQYLFVRYAVNNGIYKFDTLTGVASLLTGTNSNSYTSGYNKLHLYEGQLYGLSFNGTNTVSWKYDLQTNTSGASVLTTTSAPAGNTIQDGMMYFGLGASVASPVLYTRPLLWSTQPAGSVQMTTPMSVTMAASTGNTFIVSVNGDGEGRLVACSSVFPTRNTGFYTRPGTPKTAWTTYTPSWNALSGSGAQTYIVDTWAKHNGYHWNLGLASFQSNGAAGYVQLRNTLDFATYSSIVTISPAALYNPADAWESVVYQSGEITLYSAVASQVGGYTTTLQLDNANATLGSGAIGGRTSTAQHVYFSGNLAFTCDYSTSYMVYKITGIYHSVFNTANNANALIPK